jgi:hypothetical protein
MRPRHAFVLGIAVLLAPASARAERAAAPPKPAIATQLLDYYASPAGYRLVRRDVLAWHKTTVNGCVAFASTALRHIGLDIPLDARVDGETVSRLTRPFSRYLEARLGFVRVTDAGALRPGDIGFTENAAYPLHTFVFHSWSDARRRVARVIDNQGRLVARPLGGTRTVTPFAYALRPP